MKKSEVRIGETYRVKVSGNIANVRITGENPYGGWDGINVATKRKVRIKSAQRLRGLVRRQERPTATQPAATAKKGAEAATDTAAAAKRNVGERDAKGAAAEASAGRPTQAPTRETGRRGTMSGLDAAAKVLAEAGEPLNCKTIVERALAKGYWKTGGKTPAGTIYAAIIREIAKKGDASRFARAERGKFTLKA